MRTRLAPVVLVPLLALTGCSSGSAGKDAAVQQTPDVAVTRAAPTATAGAGTATPGTSAAASTAASAASSTAATTETSTAGSSAPITTSAPGKPAAQRATRAGTYTLDASGTITLGVSKQDASGTQSLTISPLKGQLQHSTLHGDQGDTEQDLLLRTTGTYVASLRLTSPAFAGQAKEFHPSPAVLLVPDPATVGSSWSWKAVSTDGKTTVTTANKVARTETVTIGGKKLLCAVIQTHLVLSGDVTYDAQVTTWYSPDFRLAVKDHTVGKGTAIGSPFTTDITSVMRSVTPA